MSAQYIDISSWQPENIDWQKYKAWSAAGDGVSRVCLRVDQGTGTPDALFQAHYNNAKAAGIDQFIFYHFPYPWLHPDWAGAQEEVTSFLGYLGNRLGPNDLLMLDWESYQGHTGPASWAWTWLHLCAEDAKVDASRVAIYANLSYIASNTQDSRLPAFPLIVAAWNGGTTPPATPKPWTSLLAWQYTDKAIVSGVPEPVDANFFLQPAVPPVPVPPPAPDLAKVKALLEQALAALG